MSFQDFLNESAAKEYAVGDVVNIHSHTSGSSTGEYGSFNIEKVTSTQIQVYDHNTKETLKFNKKTLRGISKDDHLLIKE